MSNRAAQTLWHRADQVDLVSTRIVQILYHDKLDSHEQQEAITTQLEHLEDIIEAMREDSREEKAAGRRYYEEQMRKEKVRREQERIVLKGPRQEEML